jgi:hypothetical protein
VVFVLLYDMWLESTVMQINEQEPARHHRHGRSSVVSSTPTASASLQGGHNDNNYNRENGSIEGYPSWLPKRPPPPAPGSTLHSLSTTHVFSGGGASTGDPAFDLAPGGSSSAQTPTLAFVGGRKPTPRSVRIVSMQDSSVAGTGTGAPSGLGGSGGRISGGGGGGGASGSRQHGVTTTRVSSASLHRSRPSVFVSRRSYCRAGAPSPTLVSFSSFRQTPDARLRAAIADPPKFRAPGLHLELLRDPSWKSRLHFYLFPLLVFAHVPIQTFLDFNAIFILIE